MENRAAGTILCHWYKVIAASQAVSPSVSQWWVNDISKENRSFGEDRGERDISDCGQYAVPETLSWNAFWLFLNLQQQNVDHGSK